MNESTRAVSCASCFVVINLVFHVVCLHPQPAQEDQLIALIMVEDLPASRQEWERIVPSRRIAR